MRGLRASGCALRLAALALSCSVTGVRAQELPEFAPYRPLYPGLYLDVGLAWDGGDAAFDSDGHRHGSALPSLDGDSRLPSTRATARFAWTFPLFEAEGWPFVSDRLHTARATFRWADLAAHGAVAHRDEFDAPEGGGGSGLGDTTFEFGTFLAGSGGWREGRVDRVSVLLLLGVTIPTGVYEHEAVANPGTNRPSEHVKVGAHVRPWHGAFADAGLGWRTSSTDEEPQFGGLAPSRTGDAVSWDAHLAQRIAPAWFVTLGAYGSRAAHNRYDRVTFVPDPPAALPASDVIAAPGHYRDGGTSSVVGTLALRWFFAPRFAATLQVDHPFAGESGEPSIALLNRTPAGCDPDALTCATSPAGEQRVDGLGPARSLASDRISLSLTWQFGQHDAFTCPGCDS